MAPTGEKIVVVNCDVPELMQNKLFNPAEAIKISHTLLPICHLYDKAKLLGITMVTPDVYLSELKGKPAVLMTHLADNRTLKLIEAGANPACCFARNRRLLPPGFI